MRNIVEQTKQFLGGPEETIVVGIADSAICIGEEQQQVQTIAHKYTERWCE